MTKLPSPYRPRGLAPILRVPGLDYDVLDELLGYALRRAQVGMFLAFHAATRGMIRLSVVPPARRASLAQEFIAIRRVGENQLGVV